MNYQQPNKKETQREPVKKTVTGPVTVRKKSGLAKIKDSFIEDAPKVKDHIIFEVFIPAAKKFILDTVTTFLFGESARVDNRKRPVGTRVSYREYYDDPTRNDRRPVASNRNVFDMDDLEFGDRGDAEDTLYQMQKITEKYGLVSVATYYDLCGMTPDNPCANNYGWTDLRTAHVVRLNGGGYIIRFPKPYPLD